MSLLQFTSIIRLLREMCCYNLELQLERQLDRARAADLVQRIQAAALAWGFLRLRVLTDCRNKISRSREIESGTRMDQCLTSLRSII